MQRAVGGGYWRGPLAGLAGALVGIGLARFAYTPLIPAVIAAGWFAPAQAAWLGAANLSGYVAGALAARPAARHVRLRLTVRVAMLVAALSFLACAMPAAFAWFFVWRFLSGMAGGFIMVLAAPAVLAQVPPARRGLAGGLIFTGVGLGIAASGVLVPALLQVGLSAAWLGLGLLALLTTLAAWRHWPAEAPVPTAGGHARLDRGVMAVIVIYGLYAFGVVPMLLFLVDFVARGLGRGMATGAACWVAFGVGAMIGPTLGGAVADRIGFRAAVRIVMALVLLSVATPLVSVAMPALLLSSAVVGAFTPGFTALALGRMHTLLPAGSEAARTAWSAFSIAWAVGQALGAQALSVVFGHGGHYARLFAIGTAMLALALVLELLLGPPPRRV